MQVFMRLYARPPGHVWTIITENALRNGPYNCICNIIVIDRLDQPFSGTGWLLYPDTIATAAHVIRSPAISKPIKSVRIKFPDTPQDIEIDPANVRIHPSFDEDEEFSVYDIALLRLSNPLPSCLSTKTPVTLSPTLEVPGFQDGHLVTDTGWAVRKILRGRPVLLYEVYTEEGHSGAPVIEHTADGPVVIGSHVLSYLQSPFKQEHPFYNCGLALTRDLFSF
jgi:V8-like Glu-specific endopeptidase